ncbi:hypothetical protein RH915_05025 [Serpentinicella sp. ANB-PHB4]|uniref:hypothetical protein n=1 Tax=Serpentinicella sp. ANB-PHB4 TaxID=3074076 RepID=UPI00285788DF|nr:hypothetical protein [Serpentinicella sp. ANB-PHB4]MDR5658845.1 hypothetical protein [Serpentinicella sp. ANB-PHB4]
MAIKSKIAGSQYEDKIHKIGRTTGIIALILIFVVPALISIRYSIFPPISNLMIGMLTISMIQIPICIAEVLTYTPMLGSGGSYLAFVSGNLTNLKIPCAAMCMESAEVKPSSKEGDIISTISIAVSTLVTGTIIIIGVIAIVPLTPILSSPVIAPAFENILPALFGGLGAYWILKQWKLAVVPLSVTVIISMFVAVQPAVLIPICGAVSIGAARWMYKKGWVKEV